MASRGGSYTLFADHRWASPKQPKEKLIFVPLRHKCELSLELPLGSPSQVRAEEAVLGQQCFWWSYTHSGALLLHLIYCEGPTPPSAWCCHLQAEWGVSFCRHLVTSEPANSRTGSYWGAFAVIVAKWFCLKQSTLYRAEKAQSFNLLLVTH